MMIRQSGLFTFVTKVKVTTSCESNIRLKEQLYRKSVFYAFERNWKIVSLKRDNAVQNCKYINILLKTVHECFLLLKLLSAKVKRFFVISLRNQKKRQRE